MVSRYCSIRILHKAPNNRPRDDDVIRCRPQGNSVHIRYWDARVERHQHTMLTNSSLSHYIRTVVQLLRNDTEPEEEFQFDFPGFPIVLFTAARLHNPEVLEAVTNMARMTQESWTAELPNYLRHDYDCDDDSTTVTLEDGQIA
jgi:uncharacterized protein YcbX